MKSSDITMSFKYQDHKPTENYAFPKIAFFEHKLSIVPIFFLDNYLIVNDSDSKIFLSIHRIQHSLQVSFNI